MDDPPETEALTWSQLTPEQQLAAADDLCFFEYTWDGNITIPEWNTTVDTETTTVPTPTPTPAGPSVISAPPTTTSNTTTEEDPTLPPTLAPTMDIASLPPVAEFRYVPWSAVDSNSIASLGYNRTTWELPGTAAIEAAAFATLLMTTQQQQAVELGFTEPTWNCYQNHYLAFDWSELRNAGAQRHWEALGWTESSWDELIDRYTATGFRRQGLERIDGRRKGRRGGIVFSGRNLERRNPDPAMGQQ